MQASKKKARKKKQNKKETLKMKRMHTRNQKASDNAMSFTKIHSESFKMPPNKSCKIIERMLEGFPWKLEAYRSLKSKTERPQKVPKN